MFGLSVLSVIKANFTLWESLLSIGFVIVLRWISLVTTSHSVIANFAVVFVDFVHNVHFSICYH